MIRPVIAFVALVLVVAPVRAQPGERDKLEKGIDNALKFLKSQQAPDGSWRLYTNPNPAATSLAVMAFLSAGHVPGEGPHGEAVEKGIRWVLKQQQPDGMLGTQTYQMYEHGISTLMLAEAAGMTGPELSPQIKTALEKAVKIILQAQRTNGSHKGGWRYQVNSPDADLSVTGWQLMALRAAKNVGCDVPADRIDWAVKYVKQSFVPFPKEGGAFRYTLGGAETVPCTGTGILCLELVDQHHTLEALKAGTYLIIDRNLPRQGEIHYFYNVYYGSQATFQLGGNYWLKYRPHLHKLLLDSQMKDGSWNDSAGLGYGTFGPAYGTAMCVLALTVEYRYLPIYQRDQDAKEEK